MAYDEQPPLGSARLRPFEDFFSQDAIIRELCKHRAARAKKRSDALFYHRIAEDERYRNIVEPTHPKDDVLYAMFPPRKCWHKYRPRRRAQQTSVKLNVSALLLAIKAIRRTQKKPRWLENLDNFVAGVRNRALGASQIGFSKPKIVAAEKDPKKHTYRPIALFESFADKIIDCLTAKYLREAFDPVLLPSCWAFRCWRDGNPPPTIHSALEELVSFRTLHKRIYVAECDIKSFFDCVSHKIAVESLQRLIDDRRAQISTDDIDPRAIAIFDSYLRCYSFKRNVLDEQLTELHRLKGLEATFPWPEQDLSKLHNGAELNSIGVPQGGAISCFIANAVLHLADKRLKELSSPNAEFRYLRYCDDMILVANKKRAAKKAYQTYTSALESLLLPMHPAKSPGQYSSSFYEGKSHLPYLWSRQEIPWIQFVGYQVRYDTLVRVRVKSLKKEGAKVRTNADKLLELLRSGASDSHFAVHLHKTRRQILHRLRQKLISMSVGRVRLGRGDSIPMPMCWSSGFRGLRSKQFVVHGFRDLDRQRERQIARVKRQLDLLFLPKPQSPGARAKGVLKYYGHPFSYAAQFCAPKARAAATHA